MITVMEEQTPASAVAGEVMVTVGVTEAVMVEVPVDLA